MAYIKRKSGAQLPTADELMDILRKESLRKSLRFDYLDHHQSIFDAHKKLSALAGSDDSWIDTYKDVDLAELVERINKNHEDLATYITSRPEHDELYQEVYTNLVPEQDVRESDALFVFGATSNARIERAVELYDQGVADRIIISGNRPHYSDNDISEASRMAGVAEGLGVPCSSILLEEEAITVPDNVKRSIDVLLSRSWEPSRLTIIATDFVLSRAMMEWYKFTPWDIEVRPVAAHAQSAQFTKEGWYKDENSRAVVLNEYAKLILETKIDLILS
jgi:hypothetical protein